MTEKLLCMMNILSVQLILLIHSMCFQLCIANCLMYWFAELIYFLFSFWNHELKTQ